MNIKNLIYSFFLFASFSLFSQETVEKTGTPKPEIKLTYLDSIKKTFVKDDLAACVDSLWLKELTNLDIYNNLTEDIQTINIDEKVDYELSTELLKARLQEMDEKSPKFAQHHKTQLWTWAECRSSELPTCGILLLVIVAIGLFTVTKTDMIGLTCLFIHFVKKFAP